MKKFLKVGLLTSILIFSFQNLSYSKSTSELNNQKNSNQNSINKAKEKLNDIKSEKTATLGDIDNLDSQLEKVQAELDKLQTELNLTIDVLNKSEQELKEANETKEKQYENLKKRIRFIYQGGASSYLEVLLNSDNILDLVRRIEYINSIMEHDNTLLERYKETEELILKKVEEIKKVKENIEVLKKENENKKSQITKVMSEKETVLKKLASDESAYQQQIKDLEKANKEIENLIIKAKQNGVKKTGASNNKIYPTGSGIYEYPVPAYKNAPYNDVFGTRINPITKRQEVHTGLDLKATYGTDIVAAESGTVIFSGTKNGYGKTVIIQHDDGKTTLYGHNSRLTVSSGQTVKRGQVIAKAGSTGNSTGVHCHFEVRINGKAVDPAPYL